VLKLFWGLSEVGRNRNTEISAQSELITKPKPKDRAYRNRNRNCFSVKLLVYEATDYSIVVEKNWKLGLLKFWALLLTIRKCLIKKFVWKKNFFNFFGSQLVIKVKTGCTVHSTQVISTIQIKDLLLYTHEKLGCSTGIKFEGLLTIIVHNISQT
jgi:hypothetical protein